jgi:hypothetical protein
MSGQHRRSATTATVSVGCGQPGAGAFADQVALELGQGGEDVEDKLAARRGGVDRLLQAPEPDAALSQAGDGVDQLPKGAAEPVELPDDQGVAGAQQVAFLVPGQFREFTDASHPEIEHPELLER